METKSAQMNLAYTLSTLIATCSSQLQSNIYFFLEIHVQWSSGAQIIRLLFIDLEYQVKVKTWSSSTDTDDVSMWLK